MKKGNPVTIRNAILYLRFSTVDQAEGTSEDRQTQKAETWCRENGAQLTKIYNDLNISRGKGADGREGLRDLLADLKRGKALAP